MKEYKEYKKSCVEWIEEIPSHWKTTKLSHAFPLIGSGTTPKTMVKEFYENGTISWLQTGDLNDGEITETSKMITALAITECGLKIYPINSLVIAMYGATIGKLGILMIETSVNQACCVLVPSELVSTKYAFYYFMAAKPDLISKGTGGGQPNISQEKIRNYMLLIPPIIEQKAIAEYLDEKCGKIDGMIEQVDKKIALYERLRRAIITKVVTKGLNPNTPLRPSGVEWIGEIPKHWEVKRFGYLAWIRARLGWKGLRADEYVESGYPFLSAFNIVNDKMNWEGLNYINQFRYEESPEIMLHPGDILLVKDGAGIGKCARVDSLPKGESTTNGSLAVITPFETANYKYIYYFIISDSFNQYKDILINGMGVPHLTQGEMKKMYLPVPPIKDQEEIAEYLDKRCQVIEDSIVKYIKQKELLERYRKALIAQVVTGKRRVCEPSFIYPDTTPISPAMAAEENL